MTTASEEAKKHDLKSLKQVSQLTNKTRGTLAGWHKTNPELFKIVLAGCYFRHCLVPRFIEITADKEDGS